MIQTKGIVEYVFNTSAMGVMKEIAGIINFKEYGSNIAVLAPNSARDQCGAFIECASTTAFDKLSDYSCKGKSAIVLPSVDMFFVGAGKHNVASTMRSQFIAFLDWCENRLTPASNLRVIIGIDLSQFQGDPECCAIGIPQETYTAMRPDCSVPAVLLDINRAVRVLKENNIRKAYR